MALSFICLDLDDTLIHATEDAALIPGAEIEERAYGPYRSFLRPSTPALLRLCRGLCPYTILLTASQKQFALGICALWNLGFGGRSGSCP